MEFFDLVIIGAGWHGLAMLKTYREVHPQSRLLVLDYAESVGGTWASERLYPGLKTNNLVGSYEFSDFPMSPEQYGIEPGQHIPGRVVHAYLRDFCDFFHLTSCIRFRTRANSVTLLPGGEWKVVFTTTPANRDVEIGELIASKLVLATGLTSEPFMPALPGRDKFTGPVFHAKDFNGRAGELAGARSVVVIGGNKSAWDISYNSVTRFGAEAHIIFRRSGGGPSWCWPASMCGWLKSISMLSSTRVFTWLDPNPYGPSFRLIRAFINRTWLGQKLSRLFWSHLDATVTRLNGYDDLGVLRPWISTFWMGNSLSVHNYETSWFDLARSGQISVHACEVATLSETAVHLADGTTIKADAVVCCTGWVARPSLEFFPQSLGDQLGFPGAVIAEKSMLEDDVRAEVLQAAPILREKPIRRLPSTVTTEQADSTGEVSRDRSPYRLYRFIAPFDRDMLRKKNLAVIGAHITLHTTMLAQAQALWITALFADRIPQLTERSLGLPGALDRIERETFYHTEYQRVRRPRETGGMGGRCPDLVFDSVPYVDLLLSDLGLPYHRKSSWYREMTEPYRVTDYRGVVKEWLEQMKDLE